MDNELTVARRVEATDTISRDPLKQVIISSSGINDEAIKGTVIGDIIKGAKDKEPLATPPARELRPVIDLIAV